MLLWSWWKAKKAKLYENSSVGRIFSPKLLLLTIIVCDREQKPITGPLPSRRQESWALVAYVVYNPGGTKKIGNLKNDEMAVVYVWLGRR